MIIDIVILCIAVVSGSVFAFAASYLKNTPILVPVRRENPVPVKVGAPIPFQFSTYGEIRDRTGHRPRLLLAMIVFSVVVLTLKPIVNASYNWNFIILSTTLLLFATLLFINLRSTVLFLAFAAIPPFLLSIFNVTNEFWLIFSSGAIPGLKIGMDLSNSYVSLMQTVKHKTSKYYKYFYTLLKWLPLLIVYQIICYCFPVLDVVFILKSFVGSFWVYPLLVVAVALTINIVWIVLPLYKETLTTSNVDAAGEFTKEVRELEKKASEQDTTPRRLMAIDRQARTPSMSNFIAYMRNPKEYPKNQAVNDYLSHKNEWLCFQSEQLTGLLFITIFILLRFFGEALEALYISDIAMFSRTFENNLIPFLAIAASIGLWGNAMFLIGYIANSPSKKDSDEEASSLIDESADLPDIAMAEQIDAQPVAQPTDEQQSSDESQAETTEQQQSAEEETDESQQEEIIHSNVTKNHHIVELSRKNPQLVVTCFHDGNEVLLKEEDPSIVDVDDKESTEQIDIKIEDVSQKLWFKFSAFLLVFGIMALIAGLAGHYSIGGSIGDHGEVEFAGSGTEISLKIPGRKSISGRWSAKAQISASSATPVVESYTPEHILTKDGSRKIAKAYDMANKTWEIESLPAAKMPLQPELDPFTIYIKTKIFENEKLIGQKIPLTVFLTVSYPIMEKGQLIEKVEEIEQKIELRILTDNRWIIHEISRYLMATGIITLIVFGLWLVVLSSYIKKRKIT